MTRKLVVAAAALFIAVPALAQTTGETPRDPKACAPGADSNLKAPEMPPPSGAKPAPTTGSGNLSDTLAKSDGVLCPPNVDPEIKAPTPEVGKMPVIPPPGSPGGNPNVQPK